MEEFKSNVSENETDITPEKEFEKKKEEKKIEENNKRRKGVIYAQPLQAEGNQRYKKIVDSRILSKIEEADRNEEGVRISFSDTKAGREVYTYITEGYAGQKKEKAIDILVHDHVSVHKFPVDVAKKMVKFFGTRAQIVE